MSKMLSQKSNKELIEMILHQIEKETGYHIQNRVYLSSYFIADFEDDAICHFHIKEIPGFIFALWNRVAFGNTSYNKETELLFFCQYERDVNKFKPSCSAFVTELNRIIDENNTEVFDIAQLKDKLKFMHRRPIKSYVYVGSGIDNIWHEISDIKALHIFIKDWLGFYKYSFMKYIKLSYYIFKAKLFCYRIRKGFNTILFDEGSNCFPRLCVCLRRKDDIDVDLYEKCVDIIDDFELSQNNINVDEFEVYINKSTTKEDIAYDEILHNKFNQLCKDVINNNHPEGTRVICFNLSKNI